MQSILIANPKGGSGKTTLSTNLAGYFAAQGESVVLGDMDRQQSSLSWLQQRTAALPPITAWDAREGDDFKPPRRISRLVVDSPAGIHGKRLTLAVKQVDKVVIPVQPSVFDMWATEEFLKTVLEEKAVRKRRTFIAIIGMRVDPRTRAATLLDEFLARFDLPVLTYLRNTQNYMNVAAQGESLFDQPAWRVKKDREQWQPLIEWALASD